MDQLAQAMEEMRKAVAAGELDKVSPPDQRAGQWRSRAFNQRVQGSSPCAVNVQVFDLSRNQEKL